VNLDELEARWRAGHVLTSELPDLARELMGAGHDVPAVRQLAGEASSSALEARQTFERALRELGRGGMGTSEAAMVLARRWADQLVRRRLPARRATKAIALVRLRGRPDVDEALEPFSELLDRYEEVGSGRFARLRALPLDRRARREAKRLLER
jgi:hypothetical protein